MTIALCLFCQLIAAKMITNYATGRLIESRYRKVLEENRFSTNNGFTEYVKTFFKCRVLLVTRARVGKKNDNKL